MTVLPVGWKLMKLSEVAEIEAGKTPKNIASKNFANRYAENLVPFYKVGDMNNSEIYIQDSRTWLDPAEIRKSNLKILSLGTVIFPKAGGAIATNKKRIIGIEGAIDLNCMAITANVNLLPKYLYFWMESIDLQSLSNGSILPQISKGTVEESLIPLPPLPEQHKIVEILEDHLSRLDAAIADVKQAKAKAAQFRRSLLQAAFSGNLEGDGTRIMTDLPDGWQRTKMGEIGRYLNGKAFKSQDWKSTGRPIIRIQNLTGSGTEFNYFHGEIEDRYVVHPGDLLFSWSATLGTYIWKGPEAVLNQHIFKVESNIDQRFHRYLLDFKIQEMYSQSHGSGMVHITKKSFDTIKVNIPPLPEQHKIVEILEDHLSRLDASVAFADSIEKQSAGLRRSLLQAAFTGQLTNEVASV